MLRCTRLACSVSRASLAGRFSQVALFVNADGYVFLPPHLCCGRLPRQPARGTRSTIRRIPGFRAGTVSNIFSRLGIVKLQRRMPGLARSCSLLPDMSRSEA